MVVASEALGTCEQLAQGPYSAMQRLGVEPATCWLQVQRPNHYTTKPHSNFVYCSDLENVIRYVSVLDKDIAIIFWKSSGLG